MNEEELNALVEPVDEEIPSISNDELYELFKKQNEDILNTLYDKTNSESQDRQESNQTQSLDESIERMKMDSKAIDTFCGVIEHDTELKKVYALVLIVMLGIELVVIDGVFILVGFNILNYSESVLRFLFPLLY